MLRIFGVQFLFICCSDRFAAMGTVFKFRVNGASAMAASGILLFQKAGIFIAHFVNTPLAPFTHEKRLALFNSYNFV